MTRTLQDEVEDLKRSAVQARRMRYAAPNASNNTMKISIPLRRYLRKLNVRQLRHQIAVGQAKGAWLRYGLESDAWLWWSQQAATTTTLPVKL